MRITPNAIYYSDCLAFLERLESEQVTLAYLDPPWGMNSGLLDGEERVAELREYLSFMSRVVQQVRRVLSETGSLYMHLEHGLTGPVRLILDQVFGADNFRTEIIWPQRRMGSRVRPMIEHETIVLYSKSDSFVHNPQFRPLSDDEVNRWYHCRDDKGPFRLAPLTSTSRGTRPGLQFEWKGFLPPSGGSWRYSAETLNQLDMEGSVHYPLTTEGLPRLKTYLSENPGIEVGSVWHDVSPIFPHSREWLNYPAQKPLPLLERVVKTGSDPGHLVLDPFCGTGTTLVAAQANDRRWLGCDSNEEAYSISVRRIEAEFNLHPNADFDTGNQASVMSRFPVVSGTYASLLAPWSEQTALPSIPLAEERFVLNQPVKSEETRHCELKEVKGHHPIDSIESVADRYVVAFLNSGGGGRIYWGIRDSDGAVVGVNLDRAGRDKLRSKLSDKLTKIQPPVDPTAYQVDLHKVYDHTGNEATDLCVVKISVPRVVVQEPYSTAKNEVFVKTDGGIKKLSIPEITDLIKRRFIPNIGE